MTFTCPTPLGAFVVPVLTDAANRRVRVRVGHDADNPCCGRVLAAAARGTAR